MIVIAGPTASGKSGLAVAVAERLGGTIVNADSMQIYRDLDILTARPDAQTLARAPHRLFGVMDGAELCSAARWADLARAAIGEITAAGGTPIVCGGTGLYLRTLLHGIAPVPAIPAEIRAAARSRHAELGGVLFRRELAALDPESAERLHEGDSQRLIRAFEVVTGTGRPLGAWQNDAIEDALPARVHILLPPRDQLYSMIDRRFVAMLEKGALAEAERLVARRLDPSLPIMKALGMPELASYLRGEVTLAAATEAAQQASRRYAKRQYTWFRHQLPEAEFHGAQFSEINAGLLCQKICEDA